DTTLNGGYQYVHNGGTASDTVVNSDGWQIVKEGGLADFTTVTGNAEQRCAACLPRLSRLITPGIPG
ncbi:hypothetical protein IIM43_004907, partial [Escherichia coli]|nr:hypothetical protein [Escherichia coli]